MSNRLYEDTNFTEEEIPSSTKMQSFNDNAKGGLELVAKAITQIVGDNRVIDDPDITTELEVIASSPEDMQVHVQPGMACLSNTICQNEVTTALALVAPTTANRYTIIQISKLGVLTTKDGAEAGSPSEPDADTDNMKLAAVYLRQNSTAIYDTDQGSNAYIINRRSMMSAQPLTVTRHKNIYIQGVVFTTGGPNSDGYYYGTSSSGFTFGKAVTIQKAAISAQEPPVGAALTITIHNVTQTTSDTITLSAGSAFEEDSSVDLDFAANDEMALQVTQVGSTTEGGYLDITLEYVLQ
jgi:hypothetical protein